MPKICYKDINFQAKSRDLIIVMNDVIADYKAQGYELTLRQLYYQLVAKALIPNSEKSYDNIGSLLNNARLAGLTDWDAIVDRTRNLKGNSHWDSPKDVLESAAYSYARDKRKGQHTYLEVWVEKEALADVVAKAARKWDVDYFCCRGYVSQSEMWRAAQRLKHRIKYYGSEAVKIIHLGDHDPSGMDMTRDIEDRIRMFLAYDGIDDFAINRIALNMDQIRKYNPPPNPAKLSDSRAGGYVSEHGYESWELDALRPQVINEMIEAAILEDTDLDKYNSIAKVEKGEKDKIFAYAKSWENDPDPNNGGGVPCCHVDDEGECRNYDCDHYAEECPYKKQSICGCYRISKCKFADDAPNCVCHCENCEHCGDGCVGESKCSLYEEDDD